MKNPLQFEPHLTLTSDVPQDITDGTTDSQAWLDGLHIPISAKPLTRFESLDIGDQFFKKLMLSASKVPLLELAIQTRAAAVEDGNQSAASSWANKDWAPHVSLLYADVEIAEQKREEVLQALHKAGIRLDEERGVAAVESGDFYGWDGGQIVLVPTWRDPKEWVVVAEREV